MSVPYRHIRHQGAVLAALGRVAVAAVTQKIGDAESPVTEFPGPSITAVVPARSNELIDDFIRWSGGQVSAWKTAVPPTMFPQWGFPLLGDALQGVDYPLAKVLNGGCRIENYAPIPRDTPLHLSGCIENIDDDGRRAILNQKLTTHAPNGDLLQIARVYGVVPLGGPRPDGGKKKKAPVVVPVGARPVADWNIAGDSGLSFACLTGDFNPIHWLAPYAKVAGFGRRILHGFGTLAGSLERIRRAAWAGDTSLPPVVDVRFTRPLKLPARVRIYLHNDEFYVGEAPGGRAYLQGSFGPLGG